MTDTPKKRGGARPNTGGARTGAGRPVTGRAVVMAVSVDPEIAKLIDDYAQRVGASRSAIIAEALTRWAMTQIGV